MPSDMIVALKEASANGAVLFALNSHAAPTQKYSLQMVPGHFHEPGQLVPIANGTLPQARQTCTVLGLQPHNEWGFSHGVNEHRVAIGATPWQCRLNDGGTALEGSDLVRLALERSHSAMHAADVLTDLLQRHGQKRNHIYLIADSTEAFVLETCGRYWALLECGHSRVVTDAAMIRQDWQRLAPGLAAHVIEQGWWQDDGSKIDFVRCLSETTEHSRAAQKRWGRATLTLAQQHGAIDLHFLRHMLADHYLTSRDLLPAGLMPPLASSFLVDLPATDQPILAWFAFGTPHAAVYFPISFSGDLPAEFGASLPMHTTIQERTQEMTTLAHGKTRDRDHLTLALERLQTKFDQDAEEFMSRAADYVRQGKPHLVPPIATEMMARHVRLFDREYCRLFGIEERTSAPAPETEEVLFYA